MNEFSRWSLPSIMAAPDMLLSQRKRRTWQYFVGKGSKVTLRVIEKKRVSELTPVIGIHC